MLHNNDDFFGNLYQAIAHEHDGQEGHSLHEMRLREAEDRAFVRQDKADYRLSAGDEVPRHVGPGADVVVERKRDPKKYKSGHNMENGLKDDGSTGSRIFSQLEKGA